MSRRIAYTIVVALLLALSVVSASSALDLIHPIVTADVTVADGIKTYTYHLTNPVGSGYVIAGFELYMPEAGARSVINLIYPSSAWGGSLHFNGDKPYGDTTRWGMDGGEIDEGETVDFMLTTPVDVPTSYNYVLQQSDKNWIWVTTFTWCNGNSSLPVPVPEPSSILTLLCGIGGLAGVVLKRRR